MPPLSRWFIKTSFLYFILALCVGVFLGAQTIRGFTPTQASLYPTSIHLLAEGWITMLIVGVAIWMFPKLTLEQPRGNEWLGWASYALLNFGLLLRLISEPLIGLMGPQITIWGAILTLAAIFQWLGGMAFVVNTWGRVKVK